MRSANRERPRLSALPRRGRMPFAGPSLGDPATLPLRCVILIARPVTGAGRQFAVAGQRSSADD